MEKKSNGLPKPYFVVKDASELPAIAQAIEEAEVIGLDLETTSLSPHHGEIRICSISFPDRSYVIDLFHTKTFEPVRAALHNSKCVKILHNCKFDQKWLLAKYKVELWPVFDTYKASALLYNGQGLGHNLYKVYDREINVKPAVEDMGDSGWAGSISDEQYMYAAEDVTYSHALREVLRKKLLDAGMSKVALLEFGAILPEAEMELNGIRLDAERWRDLYARNLKASREMALKLSTELPHPKGQVGLFGGATNFNINSTQQLQQSLAYMGLDLTSTAEKELAMQAGHHPILREVIKYKKLSKKLTAFGLDYLEHVDSVTGRIHTNFFPFTEAGRYSSSKPNLQQLPRDKEFRDCFRPEPGGRFIISDYSQVELRAAAEISNDELLIGVYARGEDAHKQTASIVNDVPLDKVTKGMRQLAKPINFGLIYGLGAEKLVIYAQTAYGVTMTLEEANAFRKKYFEGYSGIRRWHNNVRRYEVPKGQAFTLTGRRRYIAADESVNMYFNTPVQGSCADGLKTALREVYFGLKKFGGVARMVHMVHDEIIVESSSSDEELNKEIQKALEHGMVSAMGGILKNVPVEAEGGIGESWADK